MIDPKIDALCCLYKAEIAMYTAEVNNYIDNPVAVGEHGNLVETMDKLIAKIAEAEDKLIVLETHFNE
tara:strand:- start:249 stop:452 length:204 start_codon:yes stop_codon:yes gene_type:complete